jgi:hypothetical protein
VKKLTNKTIEATISNGKSKGKDVSTQSNDSNRYVIRIQAFAVFGAIRLYDDHQRSTKGLSLQL